VKVFIAILVAALLFFIAFTWWALESTGVAVLETRAPDGSLRSTHVWFAEPDGEIWLEASAPESAWYRDIQEDPRLSFSATDRSGHYVAQRIEEPDAHDQIRSLLREKYGVRDRWVTLLFDTSRSVAVRLVPESGTSTQQAPSNKRLQLPPNSSFRSMGGTVLATGVVPHRWRSALLGAADREPLGQRGGGSTCLGSLCF
jgi:hypothetical protein